MSSPTIYVLRLPAVAFLTSEALAKLVAKAGLINHHPRHKALRSVSCNVLPLFCDELSNLV